MEATASRIRTASHELITDSGTVHLAADSAQRPYHVLACNGRSMSGMGAGFGQTTGVSCSACRKGEANGRIVRAA